MSSEKNGKNYELLIRDIYQQIVDADFGGLQTIKVQHNVVLQGITNKHQIDVYWEFQLAGAKHVVIIEAKDKSRPVQKSDMQSFVFMLEDIPGQPRGCYISKNGFQSGARDLAIQKGVKLLTLDKPSEDHWEGKIKDIHVEINLQSSHVENFAAHIDGEWVKQQNLQLSLNQYQALAGYTYLCDSTGHRKCTISEIIDELISQQTERSEVIHIKHPFEKDDYFEFPDQQLVKAMGIEFDLRFSTAKSHVHIDGERVVSLILHDILEGTMRSVDAFGRVSPEKPIR